MAKTSLKVLMQDPEKRKTMNALLEQTYDYERILFDCVYDAVLLSNGNPYANYLMYPTLYRNWEEETVSFYLKVKPRVGGLFTYNRFYYENCFKFQIGLKKDSYEIKMKFYGHPYEMTLDEWLRLRFSASGYSSPPMTDIHGYPYTTGKKFREVILFRLRNVIQALVNDMEMNHAITRITTLLETHFLLTSATQ